MAANSMSDHPPPYGSQDSQTSTHIDGSDPPISAILKPDHSTRASRLSYETSQGRYSILEYHELTFPLLVSYKYVTKAIVVAVDEELDTLLKDVQRIFSTFSRRVRELSVKMPGNLTYTNDGLIHDGNITAMLRWVKVRNSGDLVHAK